MRIKRNGTLVDVDTLPIEDAKELKSMYARWVTLAVALFTMLAAGITVGVLALGTIIVVLTSGVTAAVSWALFTIAAIALIMAARSTVKIVMQGMKERTAALKARGYLS